MAISKSWKNLRSFLRKSFNREVLDWFSDVDDPVPDNSTSRKQAKRACLILPKESQNMALMKMLVFRFVVQRVHLRPHIYGLPIGSDQPIRKHKPQIFLEFLEDEEDLDPDYDPITGRISYRLMNETSESITKTELIAIANRIKLEFGSGNGFVWKKGKDLATYTDKPKGYQFQLLVRNKADAKVIIEKVLDTNNDNPDWTKLSYKEADNPTGAYPTIPSTVSILGKITREPRIRPIADVRFQYAYCSIWGKKQPVTLYDRSFKFFDALVN